MLDSIRFSKEPQMSINNQKKHPGIQKNRRDRNRCSPGVISWISNDKSDNGLLEKFRTEAFQNDSRENWLTAKKVKKLNGL